MFDQLKDHAQDALMLLTLTGSFVWLMIATRFFNKETADIIGPVGYFAIIFIGIGGSTILIRELVNSYPYVGMLDRTTNLTYEIYLQDSEEAVERKIGPNKYAATWPLRFPQNFPEYGKRDKIIVHYTGKFADNFLFRAGLAFWNGMPVQHPQTEFIVVSQAPKATIAIDHGETTPVFFLENSSKMHSPVSMTEDFATLDEEALLKEPVKVLVEKIKSIRDQLKIKVKESDEANRQKFEWHQRGISAEEMTDQQRVEIDSMHEIKTNFAEAVDGKLMMLLYIYGGIKNAWNATRSGKRLQFLNKWVIFGAVALAFIVYLSLNPEISTGVGVWFSSTVNQLVAIAMMGLVVAGIYIVYSKKLKKPF
jgi:hypothetical protein